MAYRNKIIAPPTFPTSEDIENLDLEIGVWHTLTCDGEGITVSKDEEEE